MFTLLQKNAIIEAVDSVEGLEGAGVGLIASFSCEVLRESDHDSGLLTYVIVEEIATVAASTTIKSSSAAAVVAARAPHAGHQFREYLGATFACGAMVASGWAIGIETLSTPLTGGASAALIYITAPALAASATQCGLSLGRIFNAHFDPDANRILDSSAWYEVTSDVLEGLQFIDIAHSGYETAKLCIALRRSSGRPFKEILKGLKREERKRLAEEMARLTSKENIATRKRFLQLVEQGKFSKIYSRKQVHGMLWDNLKTSIASAITLGGSAMPPELASSSGLVNKYIIHLTQEREKH